MSSDNPSLINVVFAALTIFINPLNTSKPFQATPVVRCAH
jgi:hypothetical protein